MLTDFLVALSFLTRLAPSRLTTSEAISRSMAMYPLVGAVIGLILALAARLPVSSWILAWVLVGVNLFVTRGLHWDGWADLWDGWGSGATGERFWTIVKDSHVGAFGVMGLILGLGMQAALFELAIAQKAWTHLFFAPVFGRFCCLALARLGRELPRVGLGQNALRGATNRALALGAITAAIPALLLPLAHLAAILALTLGPLALLLTLARRERGMNGDFLGAAIIAAELCALFPLAL
jgi:adenosylcobinamide-GDP ribazoletransferase